MDFEVHYTAEQEAFRNEVQTWLKDNVPPDLKGPVDEQTITHEMFRKAIEFRTKLGAKGWYTPSWPKEYGGGGLSVEETVVITEELAALDMPNITYGDNGISTAAPGIMVWGTEEQKRRFMPPIFKGEVVTWQCFTEPEAGSDLASLRTTAIRQGDEFIVNGNKIFVGQLWDVDYLYTLAVTKPDNPRHNNIGAFLIPADLPGIALGHLDLIAGGGKRTVYFEDVHVPATTLIGGETDGWKVAQSTLEIEHGGGGAIVDRDRYMDKLLEYARTTKHNGGAVSSDPENQELLVEAYLGYQVNRLLGLRNYWMRNVRKPFTYEGSQFSLNRKVYAPRLAEIMLKVMGPYALVKGTDRAPFGGEIENYQRQAISIPHPGGSQEIQKLIMARRIGVSRTREQGAAYM